MRPLFLAIVAIQCVSSLKAATETESVRSACLPAARAEHIVPIIAGRLDWLGDLIRGTRNTERVGRQAYQYTRSQDRRGSGKGFFYYLMTGLWRLAVAGTSAGIAGSAAQKRFKETGIQNAFLICPFLLGLFAPMAGLVIAGIAWLALGEERRGAASATETEANDRPPSDT